MICPSCRKKIRFWHEKKNGKHNKCYDFDWNYELYSELATCQMKVDVLKAEGKLTIQALEDIYYPKDKVKVNKWGEPINAIPR